MRRKKINFALIICLFATIAFTISSCKEGTVEEELEIDYGYEYFPLVKGKYLIYQVDSILYDIVSENISTTRTSRTYFKEVVADTLRDNETEVSYRIERFKRNSTTAPWVISDVWTAKSNAKQAERNEENLRFVRLIFPVRTGVVWHATDFIDQDLKIEVEGEAMFLFKNWQSEVLSIDKADQIGTFTFSDVLNVSHADDSNEIELRDVKEKYVKNIGLVYRKSRILDTQCIEPCIGQTWEEKADVGFIVEEKLIEHN